MSSRSAPAGAGPRAGRREWTGLAVLALPTLLLSLDLSVLHLAAPHLGEDLRPSSAQLLWILDIYGFMIAGFLVTMGTVGDRIGRRKLLMIGAAVFGVASVAAAYSTSAEMLIATRALLGLAGATLMPSTLALISNMFKDAGQRALAIGVWMTAFMAGAAVGPLVGGALLEAFWWGSVFLLGVPVMLVLLAVAPFLLPEYRDPTAGRVDLPSVALSLAAILPVIYGLKELAKGGLAVTPVVAMAAGAVFAVVFGRRQRGLPTPLVDLRLFARPAFSGALAIMTLALLASGGMMMFFVQYLQMVEGLTAFQAGLWLLPATALTIIGSLSAPAIARSVPPGRIVAAGLLLAALGFALVTQAGGESGFVLLVVGMAVVFLGVSPATVLGTDIIVGSAPPEKAGSASAMSETSGELGMALGVAVLGSVATAVYRGQMSADLPAGVADPVAEAAGDSLPGALAVAGDLPPQLADALLGSARSAFTSGVQTVAVIGAVLAVLLAVLAALLLRSVRPSGQVPGEDGAGEGGAGEGGAGQETPGGESEQDPSRAVPELADRQARETGGGG